MRTLVGLLTVALISVVSVAAQSAPLSESASLAESQRRMEHALEKFGNIGYVDGAYDVHRQITEITFKGCALKFRHSSSRSPRSSANSLPVADRSVFYVFDFKEIDPSSISTKHYREQRLTAITLKTVADRNVIYARTATNAYRFREAQLSTIQIEVKERFAEEVEAELRTMVRLCQSKQEAK
jgi:hypothetical protein